MLVFFTALVSWRLTGLEAHEVIGLALIAMILLHLLVHWSWVETRAVNAVRHSRRRAGGLVLNGALFAAMGATLISGVVISKVVLPNSLSPGVYLRWHSLHESATMLTLALVGFHLALNWDRILVALRATATRRESDWWRLVVSKTLLRHTLSIMIAIAVLTGGIAAIEAMLPGDGKVLMVYADGRRELRAPPAEITHMLPGSNKPSPRQGLGRIIMSVVVLGTSGVIARKLVISRRSGRGSRVAKSAAPRDARAAA